MSSRYVATDTKTDAQVFIKHVSFNDSYLGTIRNDVIANEVSLLKKLHHCPYCSHLLDYYEDRNNVYLVENYIDGVTLYDLLRKRRFLSIETAMEIAAEIAEVLCYFYAMSPQVLHLDIKPNNIIIPRVGHVCVIDFGISSFKDEISPAKGGFSGNIMGTFGFAAPELYEGSVDERTDIYALGVTLFQLISGVINLRQAGSYDLRRFRSAVPSVVADIVLKATAQDPGERYQTPMEFLYDLNHYKDIERTFVRFGENPLLDNDRDIIRELDPRSGTIPQSCDLNLPPAKPGDLSDEETAMLTVIMDV